MCPVLDILVFSDQVKKERRSDKSKVGKKEKGRKDVGMMKQCGSDLKEELQNGIKELNILSFCV